MERRETVERRAAAAWAHRGTHGARRRDQHAPHQHQLPLPLRPCTRHLRKTAACAFMRETSDLAVWDLAGILIAVGNPGALQNAFRAERAAQGGRGAFAHALWVCGHHERRHRARQRVDNTRPAAAANIAWDALARGATGTGTGTGTGTDWDGRRRRCAGCTARARRT